MLAAEGTYRDEKEQGLLTASWRGACRRQPEHSYLHESLLVAYQQTSLIGLPGGRESGFRGRNWVWATKEYWCQVGGLEDWAPLAHDSRSIFPAFYLIIWKCLLIVINAEHQIHHRNHVLNVQFSSVTYIHGCATDPIAFILQNWNAVPIQATPRPWQPPSSFLPLRVFLL